MFEVRKVESSQLNDEPVNPSTDHPPSSPHRRCFNGLRQPRELSRVTITLASSLIQSCHQLDDEIHRANDSVHGPAGTVLLMYNCWLLLMSWRDGQMACQGTRPCL